MPTRSYKLYSTSAATANAINSFRVVKGGYIVSIQWALSGVAGAGATGCRQVELSKQSTSSITTNDTPPTVISQAIIGAGVTGAAVCMNINQAGMRTRVDVGDTIYLHQVVAGTTPATVADSITVLVDEGGN